MPLAVPSLGPGQLLWGSRALDGGLENTGCPWAGLCRRATLPDAPGPTARDSRLDLPRPRAVRTAWSPVVLLPSVPSSVPAWHLCPL